MEIMKVWERNCKRTCGTEDLKGVQLLELTRVSVWAEIQEQGDREKVEHAEG